MSTPLSDPKVLIRRHRLLPAQVTKAVLQNRQLKAMGEMEERLLHEAEQAMIEAAQQFRPGRVPFRQVAEAAIQTRIGRIIEAWYERARPPADVERSSETTWVSLAEFNEAARLPTDGEPLSRAARNYNKHALTYQAILRLPSPYRQIVIDHWLFRWEIGQIASRRALPFMHVERALDQAMQRMKVIMDSRCGAVEPDCFFGFPVR